MNRGVPGLLITIVLVAILAIVGVGAYNAGVAQGLADSGRLAAPGVVAYHPWYGFGFGLFGLLFPLLFLFLIFGAARAWFWHGRGHGYWSRGRTWGEAPPIFEEWHRRAHGEAPHTEPPAKPPQS